MAHTGQSSGGDRVEETAEFFRQLSSTLRTTGANLVSERELSESMRREFVRYWLHDMGVVEAMIDRFILTPDVSVTYTVAESLPLTVYSSNSLDMISVVDVREVDAGRELTIPAYPDRISTLSDIARVSLSRLGINQTKLFGTIPFRSDEVAGRVTTADLAVDISKQPDRNSNGFSVEAS